MSVDDVRRIQSKIVDVLDFEHDDFVDVLNAVTSAFVACMAMLPSPAARREIARQLKKNIPRMLSDANELATQEETQIKLQQVERTPESEKDVNPSLLNKTDADIKSLMYAFGVCRRCADHAVAMLRALPIKPPEPIRTPEGFYAAEPIGFRVCSQACSDALMAVLTMQQH
jgi:hypothetical protein